MRTATGVRLALSQPRCVALQSLLADHVSALPRTVQPLSPASISPTGTRSRRASSGHHARRRSRHRQHHADPQLKVRAISSGSMCPCACRKAISGGCGPGAASTWRGQPFGQDARDVFEQAAAGDVGQRIDPPRADQRQQALHIDARRRDQRVDQQRSADRTGQGRSSFQPLSAASRRTSE
jgi:hypothetical protein